MYNKTNSARAFIRSAFVLRSLGLLFVHVDGEAEEADVNLILSNPCLERVVPQHRHPIGFQHILIHEPWPDST